MRRRNRLIKVIVAYFVITLVVAWPLVMAISSRLPVDDSDPLFNSWVMAWNGHAIFSNPTGLFDANIFYPYRDALAYSDLMLPPALLAAPVNLASGNPIIAYNLLVLASFIFSALAMFLLVRFLTGSEAVAFIAGAAYAFSTLRLAQMGHIQLLTDGFLVMTVYFAHRWLAKRRLRDAGFCGVFLALQALSGWYYGFYGALFIALFIAFFAGIRIIRADRRSIASFSIFAAVVIIGVAPFALPYLALRGMMPGFGRNLGEAVYYSAKPLDYLSTLNPILMKIFGLEMPEPGAIWEHLLWPGIFAVSGTIIAGIMSARGAIKRSGDQAVPRSKIKWFYAILCLTALILSFGPIVFWGETRITMPYWLLWRWIPGFRALRVPARLGILVTMSLVVLAAYGWQEAVARLKARYKVSKTFPAGFWSMLVAIAAIIVVALQVSWPFKLSPPIPVGDQVPSVYRWLAKQSNKTVIELPSVEVKENAIVGGWNRDIRYLYYSAYHWNRLVNGYSGYFPPEYAQIIEASDNFPDDTGVAVLRRLKIDYLIYHTSGNRRLAAMLIKRARTVSGLKTTKRFGNDIVFVLKPETAKQPSPSVLAHLKVPSATLVGAPVNIAWRLSNTTGKRLIIKPDEEPKAKFVWADGTSGSAWPRLPLVMPSGAETWMYAQIDGPTKSGRQILRLDVSSPFIGRSSYTAQIDAVSAMPVSADNDRLNGKFIDVRIEEQKDSSPASAPAWRAGSDLPVNVSLVNTGKASWTAKFDPNSSLSEPFDKGEVHVAAFWYDKQRQISDPQIFRLAYDVAPGQRYSETYTIDLPARSGAYELKFDLVALGVAWFKDLGGNRPSLSVKVD